MSLFEVSRRIFITCHNRLAPYIEMEVNQLGFAPAQVLKTGIELFGTMDDCICLNLNLRCASQVLFSLKTCSINHPDQLYKEVLSIDWENIIPDDGYFSVTSFVSHPTVNNNMFVNVRVKDGIVDRLREKTGKRPDSGSALSGLVIHIFWKDDEAEIFIDTSGESLARHGYRFKPGKAPMLEGLAAATIFAGKWDMNSHFINPMCGSGTLAIEAALIATNTAPGLLRRNYSFMHIKAYDDKTFNKEIKELRDKVKDKLDFRIIATDLSRNAVMISKENAEVAGVDHLIEFGLCDFEDTEVPEDKAGVVYLNPEYGDRLGEEEELEPVYKRIGDFLKKKCGGYKGYIFTGNTNLSKKIGLKASRRIEFYNAKIDCRLLEFELYAGTRRVNNDL